MTTSSRPASRRRSTLQLRRMLFTRSWRPSDMPKWSCSCRGPLAMPSARLPTCMDMVADHRRRVGAAFQQVRKERRVHNSVGGSPADD